jgi:hypothetical protein
MLLRIGSAGVLVTIIVELSVGCGSIRGHVPVEGKVSLDGKPLVDATVMFTPTRANQPGPFVGATDAEGKFTLRDSENSHAGVAAGEYSVIIATVKSDPKDESPPTKKEIVPAEYRSGTKKFEVPRDGTTEANFDMKSR